jgi:hypothetical protein
MPKLIHDWMAIRRVYIEGTEIDGRIAYPTLNETARQFRMSEGMLRRRAATEDWTGLRDTFIARVEQARRDARVKREAELAADLDSRNLELAKAQLGLVTRKVQAMLSAKDMQGNAIVPDGMELARVASAHRQLQAIQQIALGRVDPGQPGSMQPLSGGRGVIVEIIRDGGGYDLPPTRMLESSDGT